MTIVPSRRHVAVVFLLSTHAILLLWSSYKHSPTINETAHLVAGMSNGFFCVLKSIASIHH